MTDAGRARNAFRALAHPWLWCLVLWMWSPASAEWLVRSAVAQQPVPPPAPPEGEAQIPEIKEEVIVTATRTEGRLEDQPTRVEVLDRDEVEEKMLMTPGDIVMMLNEMGGMRVQATSPSLGAATVRIQGMQGRYTRVLFDGLPLAGQQVGGLGLLQVPPMDLGQVEVIKGVASALYGAGAMGGVVNLVSRRPGEEPVREVLFNQSTRGATDGVAYLSSRWTEHLSGSLLASGHRQSQGDVDEDGWADISGYARAVMRPRMFWDNGAGTHGWLTAGATIESREGGTMPDHVLASTGGPYVEAIGTERYDVGGSAQAIVQGRYVVTARAAASWQRHDHRFGPTQERDAHTTMFGEVAVRKAAGRNTWVAGAAFEGDSYDPKDVPRFAYTYRVPGVFIQDDITLAPWVSVSASGRVDVHNEYGTFFSPRVSSLFRKGEWTSRVSAGQGFFASTSLTEETEAAGLTRLTVRAPLQAERGTSASVDLTRTRGHLSVSGTLFGARVTHAIDVEREDAYEMFNHDRPVTSTGAELLATYRRAPLALTGTYAYVRARQTDDGVEVETPLTPAHSLGLVGMWEREGVGRVGVEFYVTGEQRLEANPYRATSEPYALVGLLVERVVGRARLFLNAENLGGVRQTTWNSLLKPVPGSDGRWTVDAWAPLDGRVLNGGIRVGF